MPRVEVPLGAAAPWLWAPGVVVGACAALAAWPFAFAPAAAAAALGVWVAATGAMHLEALADFADGLAARHAHPARYDEARRDPAVGGAGLAAAGVVLLAKFAGLSFWAEAEKPLAVLLLVPAWARAWAAIWPLVLGTRGRGMAAGLVQSANPRAVVIAGAVLALASLALRPWLALWAMALGLGWMWFVHRTVRTADGDALGAGIEVLEAALLLLLAI